MNKLNKILNCPWRTTCAACGSYEVYLKDGKLTTDNQKKSNGGTLLCDNCGDRIVIVYDKKQNKKVHYETLL